MLPLCADEEAEVREVDMTIVVKVVHVGGFIQRPGPVDYKEGATVYELIMRTGGPTKFGTLKRVSVFRDGKHAVYDFNDEKMRSSILLTRALNR